MKNICRPFTLYSDFLPPAKESRAWKYLAFGYFDGVNVGNNLFDKGWNLEKLWQHSEKEKISLDGSYTEQTIFGFRTEQDNEEVDKEFWDRVEDGRYPFLFLILLQDKLQGENYAKLCRSRRKLEKTLEAEEGLTAISYLTLDSSDLLLVLACKEYSIGSKLIDSFHTGDGNSALCDNGWNLYYSYTISAVQKAFLNDENKIARLEGILDSAYIHVIERRPGSMECVYHEIVSKCSKEIERKAALGCNDDLIVMKDIPWSYFLKFYQDDIGVLNHSSSVYQNNLIGVTTIIGEKEENRVVEGGKNDPDLYTMSGNLREECRKLKLDHDSSRGRAVRKELLSVLNSLEKYERAPFHDYIFLSALQPMKMLIEMVKQADQEESGDKYSHFYDFLTSFNMYTQNSVRSDRQFTEVPDFNIRIYDTPVKMNALYNAVIYDLKTLLNGLAQNSGKKNEYEFLTCPGVANDMQVREVYPELIKDKRLFLIDMPEKQVYSPKLMLIMLSHEISHFVGRGIRQRDFRYTCVVKMVSNIVTGYFFRRLSAYIEEQDHFEEITTTDSGNCYWKVLRDEIVAQLELYMEWESKDEFINERYKKSSLDSEAKEWWKERLDLYCKHSDMLTKLMVDHLCRICQDQDRFHYLLKREYLYQMQREGTTEYARIKEEGLRKEFEKWSWDFCEISDWNPSDWGAYSIIDNLMYLLKECFADLGAVMLLNLSVREYLEAILVSAYDQGVSIHALSRQRSDMIRGALISLCMIHDEEGCPQKWTLDEIFHITEEESDRAYLAGALWREMHIYVKDYDKEIWELEGEKEILYCGPVLECALRYLVECRKIFESQFSNNMEPALKRIRDTFAAFSGEDVEEVIVLIRGYIDIYQQILEQDLARYKGEAGKGTEENG